MRFPFAFPPERPKMEALNPERQFDLIGRLLTADRKLLIAFSLSLLVLVIFADLLTGVDVSLGVLYVFPILPVSIMFNRWGIAISALILAVVRVVLTKYTSELETTMRFFMSVAAYAGTGMFVAELARNRLMMGEHYREMEEQQALRREAEEHLRALAESSPAAIFTLDEQARILSGNRATRQLLGLGQNDELSGHSVVPHLPVLADALRLETRSQFFRTAAQCQGTRKDGDLFVAQIWFSTYQTPQGRRLAAIAVDSSEEAREREEQNLKQLLDNNRIVAAAVSHEIRNVCSAIALVYANLRRTPGLEENQDFHAMSHLVEALGKIAATELQSKSPSTLAPLDLREVLNHLRIVVEPSWDEIDGTVRFELPASIPMVVADGFGLTQALLNLSQNSLRAVEASARKEFRISLTQGDGKVSIVIEDSGTGVSDPKRLFEPFQQGAQQVGLGLYLSRAILRSYGGDLRYEDSPQGCRFVAELRTAAARGVQAA
ncbi:MAG: PAS domain-containing sensor histidine kinase [Bryobacterales bacterium]|nr:PAS domain-containing sensor histidine kinase [Bryobacterales bacterium]